MIHAEKARELTEEALYSIRERTLKLIEEGIKEAADNGYNHYTIAINEKLIDDIEWLLQNYDYTTHVIYFPRQSYLKISW